MNCHEDGYPVRLGHQISSNLRPNDGNSNFPETWYFSSTFYRYFREILDSVIFLRQQTNQGCLRFYSVWVKPLQTTHLEFAAVCDGERKGDLADSEVNGNWPLSHSWAEEDLLAVVNKAISFKIFILFRNLKNSSKILKTQMDHEKKTPPTQRLLGPVLRPRDSAEGYGQQVVYLTDGFDWKRIDSWLRTFWHHLHWTMSDWY